MTTKKEYTSPQHIINDFKLEPFLEMATEELKALKNSSGKLLTPRQTITYFKSKGVLKAGQDYIPEGARHAYTLQSACKFVYSNQIATAEDVYKYLAKKILPHLKEPERFFKGGDRESEVISICNDAISYRELEIQKTAKRIAKLLNTNEWFNKG